MNSHAEQLQNLNINRRIVNHVQLIEHVESGNQLIDHVAVEKQLMTPVCGEDQMMDHVDGHTLSTVPLTVGCPDPSMLSNIFQDTVAENFIEFSDSENHPSFLTPASSVFTSGVYSSSINQFSSPTSLYAGISSSLFNFRNLE
ncbi:uncharacterized protein LOC111697829 [Eurytemora carolleeae]|uniref:uncharacterized protein LOC111697829 n=1 Tax=Eurytemora carolleeae TaxID=1294199 RepID=UPI000C76E5C8|nr:uncharacterized protein LOC111697829 [Eurytemora carolleeae]|eukprot:XP_023323724.1 uncharacterized protein LOC111697829 [Eurytemora affinis]